MKTPDNRARALLDIKEFKHRLLGRLILLPLLRELLASRLLPFDVAFFVTFDALSLQFAKHFFSSMVDLINHYTSAIPF